MYGTASAAPNRYKYLVILWLAAAGLVTILALPHSGPSRGADALAYWSGEYGLLGQRGAYIYSPAFLQLIMPLRLLTAEWFVLAWTAVGVVAYAAAARWWFPLVIVTPWVMGDLYVGNTYGLMCLAVVAGFRYPAAWAFLVLTKVTPGVGILWFAFRREWKKAAIATGAMAAVAFVSFVIAPGEWFVWLSSLATMATQPDPWGGSTGGGRIVVPLGLRLALAVLLLAVGRQYRSVVPVAVAFAVPQMWLISFAMLAAVPPLLLLDLRDAQVCRHVCARAA